MEPPNQPKLYWTYKRLINQLGELRTGVRIALNGFYRQKPRVIIVLIICGTYWDIVEHPYFHIGMKYGGPFLMDQVAHLDLLVICLRLCALVRIAPPLPRTQEALLAQLERPQTSQRTHGKNVNFSGDLSINYWIFMGFHGNYLPSGFIGCAIENCPFCSMEHHDLPLRHGDCSIATHPTFPCSACRSKLQPPQSRACSPAHGQKLWDWFWDELKSSWIMVTNRDWEYRWL